MKTIEVELPKRMEKAFVEKRMNCVSFLRILNDFQKEDDWTDCKLEEPMNMKDFSKLIKKEIWLENGGK